VHLRWPAPHGLLLPVLPVAGFERTRGTITLLLDERTALPDLVRLRPADEARFEGPLGRGFDIDARARHLLVVSDGEGFARVRAALDEAAAAGRQVTFLFGAPAASEVVPSSLLPDEAEYVVATEDGSLGHKGSLLELVPVYEAWADQCIASGATSLLAALAELARGRDDRLGVARLGRRRGRHAIAQPRATRRRSWLQVALPHEAGCALGVCLGCVVPGSDGPLRVCREGPAFGSSELAWERM